MEVPTTVGRASQEASAKVAESCPAKDDNTVRNERQVQVQVVTGRAKDNGTW